MRARARPYVSGFLDAGIEALFPSQLPAGRLDSALRNPSAWNASQTSEEKKVCRQRTGPKNVALYATAGSTTPRFAFSSVLLEVRFVQMISRNVVEWCLGPNFPKK